MGKHRKMSFNGIKLARNEQMDRRFMFMKIFWAQGVVCPCPGAIYTYMTKYSNIFFSETARPIKAKLKVGHPYEEGMKVCINGQGHMTKMAAMVIIKTVFSEENYVPPTEK